MRAAVQQVGHHRRQRRAAQQRHPHRTAALAALLAALAAGVGVGVGVGVGGGVGGGVRGGRPAAERVKQPGCTSGNTGLGPGLGFGRGARVRVRAWLVGVRSIQEAATEAATLRPQQLYDFNSGTVTRGARGTLK